jgi:CRP-like cAMP-binding protein
MSKAPHDPTDNKLLALLPQEEREGVVANLEFLDLEKGRRITAGQPIEHIYYLVSGIGSVISSTPEGNRAEAGLFGLEGHIPTAGIAEVEISPHDIDIQVKGSAYRMRYDDYRRWMDTSRPFARVMIRYIEAFTIQLSYAAISNAVHDVNERLARWLLMCHDRVPGNEIGLTHDFISLMLAVRRPSVTTSLHVLEGSGFIKSERGMITIRNRTALEEFAQDAYGRPEQEFRRLMADLT